MPAFINTPHYNNGQAASATGLAVESQMDLAAMAAALAAAAVATAAEVQYPVGSRYGNMLQNTGSAGTLGKTFYSISLSRPDRIDGKQDFNRKLWINLRGGYRI